jgi:NAD(P)-dependent dehydrogenase (short-subunit alcohol dehydrogenase family)
MLENKTAIITGGSRGLGNEMAITMAKSGADIILTYKTEKEKARQVAQEIENSGRKVAVLQVDLDGDTDKIDYFVMECKGILKEWGKKKFDILCNNAGIPCHTPFPELSEDELDDQYNTNYKSVVFLTQALLNDLNNGGRIVNVSSGSTRFSVPFLIGYTPLKAAVESFSKYLAKILGERKITVNVIAPGPLDTDFNKQLFRNMPQVKDFIAQQSALGRIGMVDDIAGVTLFLCSDAGRWVTGQRIEISGGMSL